MVPAQIYRIPTKNDTGKKPRITLFADIAVASKK